MSFPKIKVPSFPLTTVLIRLVTNHNRKKAQKSAIFEYEIRMRIIHWIGIESIKDEKSPKRHYQSVSPRLEKRPTTSQILNMADKSTYMAAGRSATKTG